MIYRLLRAGAVLRYEPAAVVYHERQRVARRIPSRRGYNYGIGACCGLWLRQGDPYALRLLGQWLADRTIRLARSARDRHWRKALEQLVLASQTLRGLAYGLAAPDLESATSLLTGERPYSPVVAPGGRHGR
jgi:hypothetical protein